MLSEITEFFWQASHGRWEQTAATTTNQNRRNPFCASIGGDLLWVSHPTRKPYICWYIQSQADALMFAHVSSSCPSPWLPASLPGQCGAQLQVHPLDVPAPDAIWTVPASSQCLLSPHHGVAGQMKALLWRLALFLHAMNPKILLLRFCQLSFNKCII